MRRGLRHHRRHGPAGFPEQLAGQGGDHDTVAVVISGLRLRRGARATIDAFGFTVAGAGVDCRVDDDAYAFALRTRLGPGSGHHPGLSPPHQRWSPSDQRLRDQLPTP